MKVVPKKLKCEKCQSMEGIADFRTGGIIKVLCEKHAKTYEEIKT